MGAPLHDDPDATLRAPADVRPAIAWSIDAGIAAIIVEPYTRDLAAAEKRAILSAKRVRIFVDYRSHSSRPAAERVSFEHFPHATLRWCVDLATSMQPGVFDCRRPSRSEELEALLQKFDTLDNEDEFCVIHLLTDDPSDLIKFPRRHRECVPFRPKNRMRKSGLTS